MLEEQDLGSSSLSDYEWLGQNINELTRNSMHSFNLTVDATRALVEGSRNSLEIQQLGAVQKGIGVLEKFRHELAASQKSVEALKIGPDDQLRSHFQTFFDVTGGMIVN